MDSFHDVRRQFWPSLGSRSLFSHCFSQLLNVLGVLAKVSMGSWVPLWLARSGQNGCFYRHLRLTPMQSCNLVSNAVDMLGQLNMLSPLAEKIRTNYRFCLAPLFRDYTAPLQCCADKERCVTSPFNLDCTALQGRRVAPTHARQHL